MRPYHHGNLRAELLRIAVELAVEGGPESVGIREAARRAGVSASAAYRHFEGQDGLLRAVRDAALDGLRDRIDAALQRAPADAGPAELIFAAGEGYFRFGLGQPELFRVLTNRLPLASAAHRPGSGDPYQVLHELARSALPHATDEAVESATLSLWSAVHGFTVICTSGPLAELSDDAKLELLPGVLRLPIAGLAAAAHDEVGDSERA